MPQIGLLEIIPMFFIFFLWLAVVVTFFYLGWRFVRAVERIAENLKAD